MLDKFRRPDYTYLIIESEHANSTIGSAWPYSPAHATMNGDRDRTLPPWGAGIGGPGDFYGFRHTLPLDYGLYQEQATACFAFIDGHVSVMNPNMELNTLERFALDP